MKLKGKSFVEIRQLVKQIHDGNVDINEHDFLSAECEKQEKHKKIKFVDIAHGEFYKRLDHVLLGHGHLNRTVEKKKQKFKEKYGLEVVGGFQVPQIQNKIQATCVKNFGVENPFASHEIQRRISATNLERYGSAIFVQSKYAKSKIHGTEAQARRAELFSTTGHYSSATENQFYQYLCLQFGSMNIKRQVFVKCWSIDFYVRRYCIYIQFDGIYWHGLDRPIKIIENSESPCDRAIAKAYYRDIEQNVWFKKNNLKLIRITDREFNDPKFEWKEK